MKETREMKMKSWSALCSVILAILIKTWGFGGESICSDKYAVTAAAAVLRFNLLQNSAVFLSSLQFDCKNVKSVLFWVPLSRRIWVILTRHIIQDQQYPNCVIDRLTSFFKEFFKKFGKQMEPKPYSCGNGYGIMNYISIGVPYIVNVK